MIGDYVDVGADDCPPAVAVVEEIYGKANKVLLSICNDSVIFNEDDISPIVLSKEFFLQNGFIELYADEHIVRLYNHDIRLRINMYPPEYCFRCRASEMGFDYLHEFQHYLRLANLSDYANTLKIE